MLNVTVLISGSGTNLQAIIDRQESGGLGDARIRAVISNNPAAYGLERARKAGIEALCLSPRSFADRSAWTQAMLDKLKELETGLIVLAGYLVVLPAALVEAYPNRIINIHPSLIPSFCGTGFYGLKVHEEALKRGVKVTGATVHFVDSGTDTGPIIAQKAVAVREDDTPQTLQRRVMEEAEWKLLPEAVAMIAAGRVHVENGKVTIGEKTT